MNHFRISSLFVIVMCLLCAANWGRADDAVSALLPDAVKLIAAADSDLAEIEAKATKQKRDLYAALIPKLVKAQETATKAGKLEAATAAKAKVDEYKAKVAEITEAKPAVKDSRPLAVTSLGSWDVDAGYSVTLDKGGSAVWGKGAQRVSGSWTTVSSGSNILIKWQNGCVYRITSVNADSMVGQEENNAGVLLQSMAGKRVSK